jgi:hypothetical protein
MVASDCAYSDRTHSLAGGIPASSGAATESGNAAWGNRSGQVFSSNRACDATSSDAAQAAVTHWSGGDDDSISTIFAGIAGITLRCDDETATVVRPSRRAADSRAAPADSQDGTDTGRAYRAIGAGPDA